MKILQMIGWGGFLLLIVVGSRFNLYAHFVLTVFTMLVCYGCGIMDGEESTAQKHKEARERREKELESAGYDSRPYHFKKGIPISSDVQPGNN